MNNELIVANNPKSGVAEAVKTIRTNLLFSSIDEPVKSILMTTKMNADIEDKEIVRVNNWDEIYKEIQKYKKLEN